VGGGGGGGGLKKKKKSKRRGSRLNRIKSRRKQMNGITGMLHVSPYPPGTRPDITQMK